MKTGANMRFLKIAGKKSGSDDLSRIAVGGLTGLGIESSQTIEIDTHDNSKQP